MLDSDAFSHSAAFLLRKRFPELARILSRDTVLLMGGKSEGGRSSRIRQSR